MEHWQLERAAELLDRLADGRWHSTRELAPDMGTSVASTLLRMLADRLGAVERRLMKPERLGRYEYRITAAGRAYLSGERDAA